jgi:hypothetical protein
MFSKNLRIGLLALCALLPVLALAGDGTLPIRWMGYIYDCDGKYKMHLESFEVSSEERLPAHVTCDDELQVGPAFSAGGVLMLKDDDGPREYEVYGACRSGDLKVMQLLLVSEGKIFKLSGSLDYQGDFVYLRGVFINREFNLVGVNE